VNAGRAAQHIVALARQTMVENDLKAVILRVDVGNRTLVSTGLGQSMAGVPATRRMHFRIGSMAIPYLTTLLLQLQDKGRLSIDDRLSKWVPELPNADRITLKMLANSTSGYADHVQRNLEFADVLLANVFRQWTEDELLAYAFAQPAACEPGTCFNYAHTTFIFAQGHRTVRSEADAEADPPPAGAAGRTSRRCRPSRGPLYTPTAPTAASTRTRPSGALPGRSDGG
jgi:CubicO group peptidase (beta-lactamase class C family)